jgi:hypothetical protein
MGSGRYISITVATEPLRGWGDSASRPGALPSELIGELNGKTTLAYSPSTGGRIILDAFFAPSLIVCGGVRHFGISRALVSGGGDAKRWLFRWRTANRLSTWP